MLISISIYEYCTGEKAVNRFYCCTCSLVYAWNLRNSWNAIFIKHQTNIIGMRTTKFSCVCMMWDQQMNRWCCCCINNTSTYTYIFTEYVRIEGTMKINAVNLHIHMNKAPIQFNVIHNLPQAMTFNWVFECVRKNSVYIS